MFDAVVNLPPAALEGAAHEKSTALTGDLKMLFDVLQQPGRRHRCHVI